MKYFISIFFFLFFLNKVNAQEPINWEYDVEKKGNGVYEIILSALLKEGWHIYSQKTPKGGPVPTTIHFLKNPLIELVGIVNEMGKLEQKYEEVFELNTKYFKNKVVFVQVVRVKNNAKTSMNGVISFMLCSGEQCLPPSKESFSISLK